MPFLVASLAALFVGPITFGLAGRAKGAVRVLGIVVVVAVGALLVFEIIPETVQLAGWVALVPMVVGLLGPAIVERGLAAIERQTHIALLVLVMLGLGIHAVTDGIALVLPSDETGPGRLALPLAVVLHRIPVSMLIWWLLRPEFGVVLASLALAIEGLGSIVGFFGAGVLVPHLATPAVGLVQAFIAGSMLHVMLDRGDFAVGHRH